MARQDSTEDEGLAGVVSGESNYNLSVRVDGGGCFQTGTLVAEGTRPGCSLPIPLRCKWMRKIGDLTVEIPGVTASMYQISADDVGTTISVEANPLDENDLFGSMVGEIGPFELDPSTRRNLDNVLGHCGGIFVTTAQSKPKDDGTLDNDSRGDEVKVHVTREGVKAVLPAAGGKSQAKEAFAEYSADYPKVIIHPVNPTDFELVLSGSKKFMLRAQSRANRDLIALAIRCFHVDRFVPTTEVLTKVLPAVVRDPTQATDQADSKFDLLIRLERVLTELNQAIQKKDTQEKILRNTRHEKKDLNDQLMESISGCTDVILGLQDQVSDGSGASLPPAVSAERLQAQLGEAHVLESGLRKDVATARERLESLRGTLRKSEELRPQIQRNREERDMLRSRLSELTTTCVSAKQLDQADQTHAVELKRLRQDLEALHNRKEELRKELQDKESEKEDLQQNFFFVKSQLDKCQFRIAADANGETAGKELEKHGQTLLSAKDDRTRLSTRLENVLRDQEKEKVYHEQQVDRITQTNAKLHEEKDRVAREVQRLSRMYADAVKQLQAGSLGQGGGHSDLGDGGEHVGGSALADPQEVGRVRMLLREKRTALKTKQDECESLRTRIRKLAVD